MTYKILHIDGSPMGDNSTSRKISAKAVAELKARHPDAIVTYHDYGTAPLPHLDALTIGSFFTPAEQRTPEQQAAVKASDTAVDEVLAADVIVLGVPMWNFGLPSSLKAWIDHIARAGKTFSYTAEGPKGLLRPDQKVIVASARGGIYSTGPMQDFDHQERYLRDVFAFLGIKNVSFARAEGLAMGPDIAAKAIETAHQDVARAVA